MGHGEFPVMAVSELQTMTPFSLSLSLSLSRERERERERERDHCFGELHLQFRDSHSFIAINLTVFTCHK